MTKEIRDDQPLPTFNNNLSVDKVVKKQFALRCAPEDIKSGFEEEIIVYQPGGGLASPETNIALERTMKRHGITDDNSSLEPGAHQMEIKTGAHTSVTSTLNELLRHRQRLNASLDELGSVRCPYPIPPNVDGQTTLNNLITDWPAADKQGYEIRGERQRELMRAFTMHSNDGRLFSAPPVGDSLYHGLPEPTHYPTENTSVQATFGSTDWDTHLDIKRISQALLALHFNLLDSHPPFVKGHEWHFNKHQGLAARLALGKYGVITELPFQAVDGYDYFRRLVEDSFTRPMMTYPDENMNYRIAEQGKLPTIKQWFAGDIPPGAPVTPNGMAFDMAFKQSWPTCKDKRFSGECLADEKRDMGNGPATPTLAAALYWPLTVSQDFRNTLADILETDVGIPVRTDPNGAYEIIRNDLNRTLHREVTDRDRGIPRFLSTLMGTNGMTQLDLMRQLTPYLRDFHKDNTDYPGILDAWDYIAHTGNTDAQLFADHLSSHEAVCKFMQPDEGYSHSACFNQITRGFGQLYEEGELPHINDLDKPDHVRRGWRHNIATPPATRQVQGAPMVAAPGNKSG